MEEKSEKNIMKHHPIEKINLQVTGKKEEKIENLLDIIKNGVFTIDKLVTATKIPKSTLYKYIKKLKNENVIYEDEKKFYIVEEVKEEFDQYKILDFILPEILYKIKIKKLITVPTNKEPNDTSEDDEEILKNGSIKTIMVEFRQRGYEQQIAELLYDKYLKEIAFITVGIGGLIIYMSKNNKKSKVYAFLTDCLKRDA